MVSEDIVFFNDNVQLAGTLHRPDTGTVHPAVVVLHAANGGMRQFPFYQHLTTQLPDQGIAVFVFDRRGSGRSAGDFETASFDTLAGDGCAAVDYLRSRRDIDRKKIGLYGISQGGWIAPLVADHRPDSAFLIIVSGCGVSPAKQMDYGAGFSLRKAGYPEEVVARVLALRSRVNEYYRGHIPRGAVAADLENAQNEPWFKWAYLGKAENVPVDVTGNKWWFEMDYDPLPVWQKIHQPVLFLFGEEDQWVPVPESMANFKLATTHLKDVTMRQIKGTDHSMRRINDPETADVSKDYTRAMIAWLTKRLGLGS